MNSFGDEDGISLHEQPSHAFISDGQHHLDKDQPYKQDTSISFDQHPHHHHHHHHGSAESGHHEHVVTRARHKYTIRRPRALQYYYRSQIVNAGDGHVSRETSHRSDISSHLPEEIAKERERLDLFVDLIWVGIIGNLSELFSSIAFRAENPDAGLAFLVFILAFLPSWRIWDGVREFLNNYYMNDMVQRVFIVWILALSVFYGNQLAYLAENIDNVKTWLIPIYLVILGSFLAIELFYSIWIVWLRKLVFFQWLLRGPSFGLWITAIYQDGWRAIGPVVGAIVWEYFYPIILNSAWIEKLTPIEYKKALDVHHFQSRLSSFFIIILGEGVLQLVKDGPIGKGFNNITGPMVWILVIYYEVSFMYFNRDGSQRYVPAPTRNGRWKIFWVFWHLPLFASILTFASGAMFIIRHLSDAPRTAAADAEGGQIPEDEIPRYIHRAIWTCATSLANITLCSTILAFSDKPLDEPDTLKINNRYARLGMRVIFMAVILALPAKSNLDPELFLGMAVLMLLVVGIWEWNVSLERDGGLIEPKGLTLMMSRELKA